MTNRLPFLDVLRFLAIALVLGRHIYVCPPQLSGAAHSITAFWCNAGWVGVDIFFVISGFLISGLLFHEHKTTGKIRLLNFYLRRGFKIYPSYFVLLLVTILATCYVVSVSPRYAAMPSGQLLGALWAFLWPNALFVQNYFQDVDLLWSVKMTWSLAIEEHFYIALPLVFIALRGRFGWLIPIFAVTAVACLLNRFSLPESFATQTHLMPTHLRIDGLLYGVLIRYWMEYKPELYTVMSKDKWVLITVAVGAFVPAMVNNLGTTPMLWTWGYTLNWLGAGALIMLLGGTQIGLGHIGKVLSSIGKRSYSIYIWHPVIAWIATQYFNPTASFRAWVMWATCYLLGSITIGYITAALIEFPALRLRRKLTE